jgi:hypothetical protein
MKRPPFVAVLALQALLVAAAVRPETRPPDAVSEALFRANAERWMTLPDTRRDVLRERWSRFAALPSGEQETMLQRSETLRRVSSELEVRHGRAPTADEKAAELVRVVENAKQLLARSGALAPDKPLAEQMEGRTKRYINLFLDNLGKHNELSPEFVAKLRAASLSEQIRDTLLLLQADQLARYSEDLPAAQADELLAMTPRELAASVDRRRQQDGFFGRLGRKLSFTESERAQLDAATGPGERQEKARELKAAEIRGLLAGFGVAPERIEELMSGPVNELEREFDRLVAVAGAGAARAPSSSEPARPVR